MITKLSSPGNFQYDFLLGIEPHIPNPYVLIDTALDLVGHHFHPNLYPDEVTDFSLWANVPPSDDQSDVQMAWRIRRPMTPELYDTDGVAWKLVDKKIDGTAIAPPPPKKVQHFRSEAFNSLLHLVRRGLLHPFLFGSDAIVEHDVMIDRTRFRFQRDLIQNTGCMWYSRNYGRPELGIVMFRRAELVSAISSSQATGDESETSNQSNVDVMEELIEHIAAFCLTINVKISRPGVWYVLAALLGMHSPIHRIDPVESAWRRKCNKVRDKMVSIEGKQDPFCASGEACVLGRNRANFSDFLTLYRSSPTR